MVGKIISHYKITEKLGEGGMGEVYLADDTKLKRQVAIKFLPEYLTKDKENVQRFEREAEAAAALNHPNIITIFDVIETDGQICIIMEYVDGKSLREKIDDKNLAIEEILNITNQICEGLFEAHKADIVHRDIKPENILIDNRGRVKILDFGLAKLKGVSKLTKETSTLGTIHYMSPEQLQGKEVDHRSDIWSFGVVIYELLTGEVPFKGDYEQAVSYAILNEEPKSLKRYSKEVSEILDKIIRKCISKTPSNRYQSVNEILLDLSNLNKKNDGGKKQLLSSATLKWIIPLFIILMVIVFYVSLKFLKMDTRPNHIKSVAVLPFTNMSADSDQEYFTDGMTEAIITELSGIKALHVISRTSIMRYKDTNKSIPEIAGELNVDAIVEGSTMLAGDQVRISAQLIEANTDRHLWADSYNRNLENILELQKDVAQAITQEIRIAVTPVERMRLSESRNIDPEAYQMYLRGRFFWNKRTKEGLEKSIEYFQSAIEKDPTYAMAYAGLADAYSILGLNGLIASHETMPKAKTAAKKALEIDSTLAEARITLAGIKGMYEWDFAGSEIEFKQALELNPNYASGHQWYGLVLLSRGRLNEAFAELKLAQQLDPLSMVINFAVCQYYVDTKEFDKAIEEFIKIIDLNPEFPYTYYYLGFAYDQKGMYDQAVSQYRKFIQIYDTTTPEQIEAFNKMYHKEGIHGIHKLFVEWLKADSKHHYVSAYNIASTYAYIGKPDSAFSWLEKAYEERDGLITSLNLDIFWENLRSDPRYKNMLKKIGLEQ